MRTLWTACLGLSLVAACLDQEQIGTDDEGTTTQEINGPSSLASSWQRSRAIALSNPVNPNLFFCTATRIASRWAITALHCTASGGAAVGTTANFYDPATGSLSGSATVVAVKTRPGTNANLCVSGGITISHCYDSTGHVADIALLELANFTVDPPSGDPLDAPQAIMAWAYPGHDIPGQKVGAGQHDGNPNPTAKLLQVADETADTSDSIGDFHTADIRVDPGDSGGPFYVDKQILGDLYGNTSLFSATYTSVPFHLDWILKSIGYHWVGTPSEAGIAYNGTQLASVVGTEAVCQYACENTTNCEGYDYLPAGKSCGLYTNITGTFTAPNTRSALHYGQGSGRSNLVSAYDRSDNKTSVIHRTTAGTINDLRPDTTPAGVESLFTAGPPPMVPTGAKVSGYRRADGINVVVYRANKIHVIEISFDPASGTWKPNELPGPPAAGDPVGYVRADNVSAVVYRSSSNHIIELRLGTRGWVPLDLTDEAGAGNTDSDPSASVRADGTSSVTFIAGGQVFELTKQPGSKWVVGGPWGLATPASPPLASGRPYGYTHRDGTYEIVYGATDGRVIALWLSGGWHWGEPVGGGAAPLIAVGSTPAAYVRTDGLESIVYRTSTNRLEELQNNLAGSTPAGWTPNDLTARSKVPLLTSDPTVSIHVDARNSIVYSVAGNRAQDLSFLIGTGSGPPRELTLEAGETP
jgi:hypothetical protein